MIDAFIYQAALLCEPCGKAQQEACIREAHSTRQLMETGVDSEGYPAGPYADGGGEADTPQHCDHCGTFLHNPLTGDGSTYVRDAFGEFVELGRGKLEVLADWIREYPYEFDDYVEITLPCIEEDRPLNRAQNLRLVSLKRIRGDD